MTILRATLWVGAATMATRVLGFLRDVLLASVLGTGPVAEAFFVALRLPNLVRRAMGEGGWNTGYVPLATRLRAAGDREGLRSLARDSLALVSFIAFALVVIGELFAPLLVRLMAPGLADDTLMRAVFYLRAALPLIFGVLLSSLISAILVAQQRFAAQAFIPVLVNASLVAVLLMFDELTGGDLSYGGFLLALTASLAACAQILLLLPALFSGAESPVINRPRLSGNAKRMIALAAPGFVIQIAGQVAVLLVLQAASHVPAAIAHLNYADRVAQLPLGFIASGLATVALPAFASELRKGMGAAFHRAMDRAFGLALALALPAAIALVMLAEPITAVLFERGAFTATDRIGTAAALSGFALSLPFAALARVQMQVYFAREQTRLPLIAAALGLAATILALWSLSDRFGVFGFAAALAFGQIVTVLVQHIGLHPLTDWQISRALIGLKLRVVGASGMMALSLAALSPLLSKAIDQHVPLLLRVTALSGLCLGGLAAYGLAAWVLGLHRRLR